MSMQRHFPLRQITPSRSRVVIISRFHLRFVSHLLRGRLFGFSADRLFAILNRLGHSVEVRISAGTSSRETHTRVMIG